MTNPLTALNWGVFTEIGNERRIMAAFAFNIDAHEYGKILSDYEVKAINQQTAVPAALPGGAEVVFDVRIPAGCAVAIDGDRLLVVRMSKVQQADVVTHVGVWGD